MCAAQSIAAATTSKKRTLDAFFKSPAATKKAKLELVETQGPNGTIKLETASGNQEYASNGNEEDILTYSNHPAYPIPIADFPPTISRELSSLPATVGRALDDQPDLDLLYFEPYIPRGLAPRVFTHLRGKLPFYRVEYDIQRGGGVATHIRTPRFTTVFGLDATARFEEVDYTDPHHAPGARQIVDARTGAPVVGDRHYTKYAPRPLPACLEALRRSAEAATGCVFNFCLVNYYASGADSIAYHSDDERFLGPRPAIASFSLGARRDFCMKHKPVIPDAKAPVSPPAETKPIKLPLASGDMILMRGATQANWLHSIPKRTGKNAEDGGRINITFRKALVRGGTENYYNYNVGTGPVYRWDEGAGEMRVWKKDAEAS